MRYLLILLLFVLPTVFGCGGQRNDSNTTAEAPSAPRAEDGYVGFPETGYSAIRPEGFDVASNFVGFQQVANPPRS